MSRWRGNPWKKRREKHVEKYKKHCIHGVSCAAGVALESEGEIDSFPATGEALVAGGGRSDSVEGGWASGFTPLSSDSVPSCDTAGALSPNTASPYGDHT